MYGATEEKNVANVHNHNYYIQPLNYKSKLSLLPSLDNPAIVYYNNNRMKF